MGTTAVAGGAITLTSPSALWSRSRFSPWSLSAGALGFTLASWQTCAAMAGDTREKSSQRTCFTVLPGESASIV